MTISEVIVKMIDFSEGNEHDIAHFLRVWGYAKIIGECSGLDEKEERIVELSAIVHDIACPKLRPIYGCTPGDKQEEMGKEMVKEFFADTDVSEEEIMRVAELVGLHHTYHPISLAHQVLLEADFLANAGEDEKYTKMAKKMRENVFQTKTGIHLLESMFLEAR